MYAIQKYCKKELERKQYINTIIQQYQTMTLESEMKIETKLEEKENFVDNKTK